MISWASTVLAVTLAFLAFLVRVVEAFKILLAVATILGWGWTPALVKLGRSNKPGCDLGGEVASLIAA